MEALKLEEVARLAGRVDAGAALEAELPASFPIHAWPAARAEVEQRLERGRASGELHEPITYSAIYEAERRLCEAERAAPVFAPPPPRPEPRRPSRKKRLDPSPRPKRPPTASPPPRAAAPAGPAFVPSGVGPSEPWRPALADPAVERPSFAHAAPSSPPPTSPNATVDFSQLQAGRAALPFANAPAQALPQHPPPTPAPLPPPRRQGLTNATMDLSALQDAIAAAEAARPALPFGGVSPPASRAAGQPRGGLPFASADQPAGDTLVGPPARPQPSAPNAGLPFRPASGSTPPPAAPPLRPQPPRDALQSTAVGGDVAATTLPFPRTTRSEPPAAPAGFDEFGTVERYAELCAALQSASPPAESAGSASLAGVERVFARFGLADPVRRKRYDETWKSRLAQSPAEYAAWQKAYWERLQRR